MQSNCDEFKVSVMTSLLKFDLKCTFEQKWIQFCWIQRTIGGGIQGNSF